MKEKLCGNCGYFKRQSFLSRLVIIWSHFWEGVQYVKISGECVRMVGASFSVFEDECPCSHWVSKENDKASPIARPYCFGEGV